MANTVEQILKMGKAPHSLLLIDASQSDAIALAEKLLGEGSGAKIASGNHPDLHIYAPEGKKGLHPMASIQKIIQEMSLPPFEAKSKVFMIEEAEKMLPSSSNALLKTLEEPNEDTFFLLLSDHPEHLLPTIHSRLHPVSFSKTEASSIDLSPFFALAQRQEWDRLLDEIPEEEPEAVFSAFLQWAIEQKNPRLFRQISQSVEQAQKALGHSLRPRTVLLNLFLQI